jgi:hypothetical protein
MEKRLGKKEALMRHSSFSKKLNMYITLSIASIILDMPNCVFGSLTQLLNS